MLLSRKIYLYNFDPLKPHFYTVKLGFTGVYIIFHISVQNRWGGSNEYPQSMFCAEIWKISQFFLSENFQFLEMKFSIYLNRRVFVMCCNNGSLYKPSWFQIETPRLDDDQLHDLIDQCVDSLSRASLSRTSFNTDSRYSFADTESLVGGSQSIDGTTDNTPRWLLSSTVFSKSLIKIINWQIFSSFCHNYLCKINCILLIIILKNMTILIFPLV